MQNSDEALQSIILAGQVLFIENAHNSWTTPYILIKCLYNYTF